MKVCSECRRCYDDPVDFCTEENHPELSAMWNRNTEMVAGYHLESQLRTSGDIEAYRGRHKQSGQICLIKISSVNEDCRERFLTESQIAATLYHPNIVDVYESGMLENGEFFVVAEDARGSTLREVLNDVRVPELLTSILVVRQAAEALHFLHQNCLTHRAVNPENIVITTDAENHTVVRIQNLDFGAVCERSILSNKFLADSALNSLKYFAPEQGTREAAGAQADVYGLGIVFYEMLAGAPPFEASTAAGLISKHRSQPPPEVRIDNFNLRMLVTHALSESLQKPPRLRQSSANVFARQLRHIEQLATHVSTPPPAVVVPNNTARPAAVIGEPPSGDRTTDTRDISAVPEAGGMVRVRTSSLKKESINANFSNEQPRVNVSPPPKSSPQVRYCPSILEVAERSESPAPSGLMFADPYISSRRGCVSQYRSAMVSGAGLFILIALFFIGDAFVSGRVQPQNPRVPRTSTTSQPEPPAVPKPAAEQRPLLQPVEQRTAPPVMEQAETNNIAEPVDRDNRPDVVQYRAVPTRKNVTASAEKADVPAIEAAVPIQTAKAVMERNVKTLAPVASTLVISSKNGKLTSTIETAESIIRERVVAKPLQ